MINKAILVLFALFVVYMVKGDPGTIVRYRHHVVPVSRYIYGHYHDYHDHHDHHDHIDHFHYPHHDHYHEHPW